MIPKKIHYCWIGGNPLPKLAKKCIASWKKHCPDYEIIEWNEDNYDFTKNKYMKDAFEAKKWGFVPDYARLDIIYQHGGIYLDTDVEIIKSFDSLLKNKGFAGFESEQYVNFGQGFGAEAGNQVLKTLLDSYETIDFLNRDGSLNTTPSPVINTEALNCKYGKLIPNKKQILDNGFVIYPIDYFCPKSMNDDKIRITDNTYSIHHFSGSWIPKDAMREWKKSIFRMKHPLIYIYPKQFTRKLMGDKRYEKVKSFFGRGK